MPFGSAGAVRDKEKGFRAQVVGGAQKAGPFQAAVLGGTGAGAAPLGGAHCPSLQAPQVSVRKEGEVVTSILIQCSCGQAIELTCLY